MNAEKLKVLFVDDDPPILEGIRRMLRAKRNAWDMRFFKSPVDALQSIEENPVDVIIADMRMPGMSGAELLTLIREKHPETIRIILSGYCEQKAIMQTVSAAHQYLSKPCNAEELSATIERALQLRQLMHHKSLITLLAGISHIPSLPEHYQAIREELESEDPRIEQVVKIIETDAALSLKILQLVNSGFFGLPYKVSSVSDASQYLGVETIQAIVLFSGVASQIADDLVLPFSYKEYIENSLLVARLAQEVAELLELPEASCKESFTAGILHDVGKLILALRNSKQYASVITIAQQRSMLLSELEQEIFGVTHGEIGSYLLMIWGLPNSLAEAVAYHSQPSRSPSRQLSTLTAVHIADSLVRGKPANSSANALEQLDYTYIREVGIEDKLESCVKLHKDSIHCQADNE